MGGRWWAGRLDEIRSTAYKFSDLKNGPEGAGLGLCGRPTPFGSKARAEGRLPASARSTWVTDESPDEAVESEHRNFRFESGFLKLAACRLEWPNEEVRKVGDDYVFSVDLTP